MIAAGSAAQAWKAFQQAKPGVLVTDIGMPGEDGYALLERLRAHDQQSGHTTPAIALTAYASSIDRQIALERGFQIHLVKPFEPDDLINAVARLAGRLSRTA